MTKIKDKILEILEANKGKHVSGSSIGEILGVSRTAIWKGIKSLKDEGYNISSKTNKGYVLSSDTDIFTIDKVKHRLNTSFLGKDLRFFKTIDSTNTSLRELAYFGEDEGLALIADEQTSGRGRNKKTFYSPNKNGIYMSFLLRPNIAVNNINLITFMSAVCVVEAIEKVCSITLDIKWVNDLLYQCKKVCGILTEASIEGESGIVDFLIVGIGININNTIGFPEEFKSKSTALKLISKDFSKSELIAEILNTFEHYYLKYLETGDATLIIKKYRERLCILGKEVKVINRENTYYAQVLDFNDIGQLILKRQDGTKEKLISGEISLII